MNNSINNRETKGKIVAIHKSYLDIDTGVLYREIVRELNGVKTLEVKPYIKTVKRIVVAPKSRILSIKPSVSDSDVRITTRVHRLMNGTYRTESSYKVIERKVERVKAVSIIDTWDIENIF
jgi:hypothetical protein